MQYRSEHFLCCCLLWHFVRVRVCKKFFSWRHEDGWCTELIKTRNEKTKELNSTREQLFETLHLGGYSMSSAAHDKYSFSFSIIISVRLGYWFWIITDQSDLSIFLLFALQHRCESFLLWVLLRPLLLLLHFVQQHNPTTHNEHIFCQKEVTRIDCGNCCAREEATKLIEEEQKREIWRNFNSLQFIDTKDGRHYSKLLGSSALKPPQLIFTHGMFMSQHADCMISLPRKEESDWSWPSENDCENGAREVALYNILAFIASNSCVCNKAFECTPLLLESCKAEGTEGKYFQAFCH